MLASSPAIVGSNGIPESRFQNDHRRTFARVEVSFAEHARVVPCLLPKVHTEGVVLVGRAVNMSNCCGLQQQWWDCQPRLDVVEISPTHCPFALLGLWVEVGLGLVIRFVQLPPS